MKPITSARGEPVPVVMSAQSGQWEQLETVVKSMQDILMRVRYFPKPVVVAPAGLALGGGAEVVMRPAGW